MHYLVERKDLMFGKKGIFMSLFAKTIMNVLDIDKVNKLYDDVYDSGDAITTDALHALHVELIVSENSRNNIPATGAAILIANHPTGALDGIMMLDIVAKIRKDVKFMGNFLLNRIEPMAKFFITIDPFNSRDKSINQKGIRQSIEHLRNGGLIVIFPAGEVATWQKGFSKIEDKAWGNTILKFIQKVHVPVIPAYIEAGNSLLFHLVGKINPLLRTALLPHELINKKNKKIHIRIGSPIKQQTQSELTKMNEYGNYLRANVMFLQKGKKANKTLKIRTVKKTQPATDIIHPVAHELLCREIESIHENSFILSRDNYSLYLVAPDVSPNILKEIGRLRELTFRSVGEGTMQEADNDKYDAYYHQLFIWDSDAHAVAGAYRMGFGDRILKQFGLPGFYIQSLFRMDKCMKPYLAKTIELGRSFITQEYQRKAHPLLLLWKGILHVLITHPEYEYLLGATSIAGNYSSASKLLIANYLKKFHYNHKWSSFIKPIYGMKGIRTGLDLSLVENIESIELIKKLVMDMEDQERTMPVLIRKYLQLRSQALAFNVDRCFCNTLDALMLLEVKGIPDDMIKMISR